MALRARGFSSFLCGLWFIAGAVWLPAAQAIKTEDLLHPDQAYRFEARATAADMTEVEWTIAEGYYLYRDKLRFESKTPSVQLGMPVLPPPTERKHDEFFGEQPIYRGKITVAVPVIREAGAPASFTLAIRSQGCADAGVCFPPQTHTVSIELPSAPGGDKSASPGGVGGVLGSLASRFGMGSRQKEFLDPDQAFSFDAEVLEGNKVAVRWRIADGYYLYRDKFALALTAPSGAQLGDYTRPPGEPKVDESFGSTEVYHRQIEFLVPMLGVNAGQAFTLEARYQGCADAGLCYPPITKTVELTLDTTGGAAGDGGAPFISEQDRYAQSLAGGNRFLAMLSFFGLGLLLAFTPCVFPMVPILSSLIVGQGAAVTTRRAFLLSLSYVLAMAVTYTIAGIIAGLFGANLQAAFQNPWIIGIFSALFVLLALSMFGFYDLQIPNAWQSRLTAISNKQQGGTLLGAGIMGLFSALIVGPCVAAPLAGALIYIGQTGDAVFGGMALFSLSLGMGAPLLAIGASAGKWLPRTGGWMNTIKAVFGVMLLALAIWMLSRVLPGQITMVLWGALLIVTAVYMGALDRLMPDDTGWRKLWKGAGLVLMVYGGVLILGAAAGGKDVLQPLRGTNVLAGTGEAGRAGELNFAPVKGVADFERALAAASAAGKPVMLDFYADWCVSCKEMEHSTFSAPGVQRALAQVVLLQADVTDNDDEDQALLKHFGIFGPPSIMFFGADGVERRPYRQVGFLGPEEFARHVEQALGGS